MYIVTTPPSTPVVSLSEIKHQLVIDESVTDDDTFLQMLEVANREYVELYLNRVLPVTELKIRVCPYGKAMVRVPTPAISIVSIVATKDGETVSGVSVDDYELYQFSEPHMIIPKYGKEWPIADHVEITLSCGYTPETMPVVFKQAVLIRTADQYENRTEQVRDRMNNVTDMLYRYRITEFSSGV